uniref:Uncharacterized protein n=1 Tax=Heliothis virescens TaxID=7102 RepID=A0A2A4JYB8_HELVI
MFKKVKILAREFKPKHWTIESEAGVPITDKVAILERWRNYCQQLYSNPTAYDSDMARLEYSAREPDILLQEIEDAVAKLKPKACGEKEQRTLAEEMDRHNTRSHRDYPADSRTAGARSGGLENDGG